MGGPAGQARRRGCWEVEGELRAGQGGASPLQEAVLCLSRGPGAA